MSRRREEAIARLKAQGWSDAEIAECMKSCDISNLPIGKTIEEIDPEYADFEKRLFGHTGKRRRTSERERAEKRRRAELQDQRHAEIQAAIDRCAAEGMSTEEIMEDFCLLPAPQLPPAQQFIVDHVRRSKIDKVDFDDAVRRALVALVQSDVPLDRPIRQQIACELYRLYYPDKARDRRDTKQAQNRALEMYRNDLMDHRGMTADEADAVVFQDMRGAMGIASVEAMRRRLRPSRK